MISDLKPYPAYKDSGVEWLGEVPVGWELRRLGSITTPVSRRGRTDLPLLSVLREKGVILREEGDANHNVIPEDLTNYKVVNPGDLVINKMKAWQGSLGVAATRGIVSPAYFVFRLHELGRPYAHILLRSKPYVGAFAAASSGIRVDQWDLSIVGMKAIPVLVPTDVEQSAIVRFLDYADLRIQRFMATKEQLINLLEEEKRAIIHSVVTRGLNSGAPLGSSGLDWLGDVPESWDIIPLRLRYSVKLGKMLDAKQITGTSLTPYLRNTDVQWDRINTEDLPEMDISPEEQDRYTVKPGDLLVCEGGEVGRAAIWNQPRAVGYQKALHRLRPYDGERDKPRFLYYMLRAIADLGLFKADGSESTIAHLTAEKLRRLRVPFPPSDEQEAIARQLDKESEELEGPSATARSHIDLLNEYRHTSDL